MAQTDMTGTSTYSYDADGRLLKSKLASGVTTSVARDGVGRVTAMDHVSVTGEELAWPSPCVHGDWRNGWGSWWSKTAAPTAISIDYNYDGRGLVSRRDLVRLARMR